MKNRQLLVCLALLLFPAVGSWAQEQADNNFSLNLSTMTRGELRYGGFLEPADAEAEQAEPVEGFSRFIIGRYRLTADYSRSWLEAKVALQQSGTWGAGGGSFSLNEGWVMLKSKKGLFTKIGRQILAYDDERIIGSNDWAMTAPTHDVLKLGYEGHQHKVHLLFAYNQNPENMDNGTTYYKGGNQPYKSMQALWYHYDTPKSVFGASLLFMNIGMQSLSTDTPTVFFQQLVGTYMSFKPKYFSAEGAFYYQFGKQENGLPLSAYLGSIKLTAKPRDSYSIYTGYDYLSGDTYFAVPQEGQIGLIHQDKARGFNPIYGSHHEFYGAMDFFYMSTFVGNFTPGLQNAYLGSAFTPVKGLNFNVAAHCYAMATKLPNVDQFLGLAAEFSANYAFTKYISAECGYSYMYGSETMKFLKRVSDNQQLHWAYVMLVVNPTLYSTSWQDKKNDGI